MSMQKVLSVLGALLIVGFGAFIVVTKPFLPVEQAAKGSANILSQSATWLPVPEDISISPSGMIAGDGFAVPTETRSAGVGTDASYRAFHVQVENNMFIPSTIAVKQGDIAHIEFLSNDQDYDFTQPDYGFYMKLPQGKPSVVEGTLTTPGKFTFYCKMCGGPEHGPIGYLVVVPK